MPSPLTSLDRSRLSAVRSRLAESGPFESGPALSGLLGSLGFDELAAFQQSMGVSPSGELDRPTLQALRDALVRKREAPDAIRRGQQSDDIARVERQLKQLGYDVGKADGVSDAKLSRAIGAFKRDEPGFDNTTGYLSQASQALLGREAAGLRHAPYRGRHDLTVQQHRFDQVLGDLAHQNGVGEGDQRPAIGQLQTRLKAAGFDPQRTDGVFDQRTAGALKAFQRRSGVDVTGRLDAATWKKLSRTIIDTDQPASPAQREGEKSGAVKRTERLLAKKGFHPGAVDGLYSKQTAKAVRAFERKTHRHVDGQLGAKDLAALKKFSVNPFKRPPADYHRISWHSGVTVNKRTAVMEAQAEAWAKKHGVPANWPMWQGSYNAGGVGQSAGTHDGGGAFDVRLDGKSPKQIHTMVEALRRAGFAAWYRPTMSPKHIHAIAIGDREMSAAAHAQVVEYFHGGDGLIGSAPDPHRDIGRPIPDWAKKFRDRII